MQPQLLKTALLALLTSAPLMAHGQAGVVLTQTNDATQNRVLAFRRFANGQLAPWGSFPTGGLGRGSGLGSQGAVTLVENRPFLLVVNAGSNELSVFRLTNQGLILVDIEPTRGMLPTSVVEHGGQVFVLNAGMGANSVARFTLSLAGDLAPAAEMPSALSAPGTAPAQVGVSPDGQQVIVSERMTNVLSVFMRQPGGALGARASVASNGATPFGFEFGRDDTLIVSEAFGGTADASAVSSYRLAGAGLSSISASVPTTESAACWIAITRNGRFCYTTNTGSGTVSGYRVGRPSGVLTALDADGETAVLSPGANPLDTALSRDSRFLYVLSPATGEIAIQRVRVDGALDERPSTSGIPVTAAGLAAR